MKLPFDHIVLTSDEPFGKMFHTQILFAHFLAQHNKVIYYDPPEKWKVPNLFKSSREQEKSRNLVVLGYHNLFPSFLSVLQNINEKYNRRKLVRILHQSKSVNILIWHFDSYRNQLLIEKEDKFFVKRIYHVIDPYFNNPLNGALAKKADLLIITSPRLNDRYKEHAHKLINIPQVIDLENEREFLTGSSPQIASPFLVLLGTMSDDIDYNWLKEIAEQKEFNLVLIGKKLCRTRSSDFNDLVKAGSVHYLGEMTPSQFYPVLAKASAGLIIYSADKRGGIRSPLKTINYLVAGIPVITNSDAEIDVLREHCIYQRAEKPRFLELLRQLRDGGVTFDREAADGYLANITMAGAVEKIMQRLAVK